LIQKEILKLKKELALNELNLIKVFLKKRDGISYLHNHSQLIDKTLSRLWQDLELRNSATLIACGGYGRQELFPYSDIDLLILIPKSLNKSLSQKIEQFISLVWDLGLRVGHSVRNINQTKIEIKKDITVQTNLLENRYLNGDKVLYKNLIKIIISFLTGRRIFKSNYFRESPPFCCRKFSSKTGPEYFRLKKMLILCILNSKHFLYYDNFCNLSKS